MLFLDLDGTLLDDRRRHYETYAEVLGRPEFRGMPIPEKEYWERKIRGEATDQFLRDARLFPTKFRKFREVFEARLESPEMLAYDELKEGSATFLGKLYTKTPIVLVTQRRQKNNLEAQLVGLGIRKYFVEVLFGGPSLPRRPDRTHRGKEKAKLIRARYKMPPTDSVLVGDSENDVYCAREMGWTVFLVEGGHRVRKLQMEADPDRLLPDLPAALKYLLPGGRWQR